MAESTRRAGRPCHRYESRTSVPFCGTHSDADADDEEEQLEGAHEEEDATLVADTDEALGEEVDTTGTFNGRETPDDEEEPLGGDGGETSVMLTSLTSDSSSVFGSYSMG
jgi:hypothetical protein